MYKPRIEIHVARSVKELPRHEVAVVLGPALDILGELINEGRFRPMDRNLGKLSGEGVKAIYTIAYQRKTEDLDKTKDTTQEDLASMLAFALALLGEFYSRGVFDPLQDGFEASALKYKMESGEQMKRLFLLMLEQMVAEAEAKGPPLDFM